MNQTAAVHKNSVMMNPMIRRLSRVEERDEDNCASYGGIAVKTIIFMLAAVAGFAAYFVLHGMLAGSPTMEVQGYTFYQTEGIICAAALVLSFLAPFIALIIRPLIPLFGIIYCAGLGYSITLLGSVLGADYAELVFLALGLTILLVAVHRHRKGDQALPHSYADPLPDGHHQRYRRFPVKLYSRSQPHRSFLWGGSHLRYRAGRGLHHYRLHVPAGGF